MRQLSKGKLCRELRPARAIEIRNVLQRELDAHGVPVTFATINCLGLCEEGPNARLAPANSWFHEIRKLNSTRAGETDDDDSAS